jgi:hypothetical protein
MVLCDRCAGIDFGSLIERACIEAVGVPSKPNYIPPHPITKDFSFAVLRSAALQGCDLCSLIHRGLLDRTNTRPIRKDSKFEDLKLDSMLVMSIKLERCHEDLAPVEAQCSALKVQCYTSNTDLGKAWNGIWLTLASEMNSQYVPAKRLAWNPSLWCSWMDNCITRHETCEATKQDGNPPPDSSMLARSIRSPSWLYCVENLLSMWHCPIVGVGHCLCGRRQPTFMIT